MLIQTLPDKVLLLNLVQSVGSFFDPVLIHLSDHIHGGTNHFGNIRYRNSARRAVTRKPEFACRETGVTYYEVLQGHRAAYDKGEEVRIPISVESEEAIKNLGFDPDAARLGQEPTHVQPTSR